MKTAFVIWFLVVVFAVIGEIRCIVKAINCDWEPIGKAEIIYTGSALTGFGAIVGWIHIEDSKPEPVEVKPVMYKHAVLPKTVYIPKPKNFAYRRM